MVPEPAVLPPQSVRVDVLLFFECISGTARRAFCMNSNPDVSLLLQPSINALQVLLREVREKGVSRRV